MSYTRIVLCCIETGQHIVKTVTIGTEQAYLGLVFINGKWYRGWVNVIHKDDKGCYFVAEDYYTLVFTPTEIQGMRNALLGEYILSPILLKLRTRNILRASGELTALGSRVLNEITLFDKTI